jgi:hypothetical protein
MDLKSSTLPTTIVTQSIARNVPPQSFETAAYTLATPFKEGICVTRLLLIGSKDITDLS